MTRGPNEKFRATADVHRHVGIDDASVEANVEFTYRYYCRLLRLRSAVARSALLESVDPSGSERLLEAAARGRGIILASAHLGDFDVVGAWLAKVMELEVVVITDAVAERSRQAFFDGVRRAGGLIVRRRADTRMADIECDLARGRVVLWMLDRTARGPAVQGQWLGQPALLPVAPYVVARRTGCSLIAGATITGGDGRRSLVIGDALRIDAGSGDLGETLSTLAATLCDAIRAAPWQWHVPVRLEQLSLTRWARQTFTARRPRIERWTRKTGR